MGIPRCWSSSRVGVSRATGEIPELAKYVSSHNEGQREVLGIDTGDQRAAAQAFTKKDHVTFNVAFDPNDTISAGSVQVRRASRHRVLEREGRCSRTFTWEPISTSQLASGIRSLES